MENITLHMATMSKDYSKYYFFVTPKFVMFDSKLEKVLLARRNGEADHDGTFSFIGGKLEKTDKDLLSGMMREKDEEIGIDNQVSIVLDSSRSVFFERSDGQMVLVPHYPAIFEAGKINLNEDEYSEFAWVSLSEHESFEPKIGNITEIAIWANKVLASSS